VPGLDKSEVRYVKFDNWWDEKKVIADASKKRALNARSWSWNWLIQMAGHTRIRVCS
jgi:hypothetical protein